MSRGKLTADERTSRTAPFPNITDVEIEEMLNRLESE